MNGINTSFGTQSLYQNDGTQGSAKSDDKKQDNKNDSNVIKGAGLNLNQTDLIGQKMANAQKEALKKIMDGKYYAQWAEWILTKAIVKEK